MASLASAPDAPILDHLDALYSFAQLVTSDADAASRLVRDTYARAFAEAAVHPSPPSGDAARTWLFRLLLDERREHKDAMMPLPAVIDLPDALDAPRQAQAEALTARLLPSALLSLPARARLLLVLCDVEGLSCADAGEVLGLSSERACARHAEARASLVAHLRAAAAPHEQPLLDRVLDDETLARAVAEALTDALAPLPPTLRPQIPIPEPYRVPVAVTEGRPRWSAAWGWAAGIVLLAGAGLSGYYLTQRRIPRLLAQDLIEVAVGDAPKAVATLRTTDAGAAETFALDHVGWRLSLPAIRGYTLEGAGVRDVSGGVSVPVFVYAAPGKPRVTLYGFTYHLLDQAPDRLRVPADVLNQLEAGAHYEIHDLAGTAAVLWRDRDDLFVAVARTTGPALRDALVRE